MRENYLIERTFDVSYLLIGNNDLASIDRDALAHTVSGEIRF